MRKLTRTIHKIFSPSGKGLGQKGFTLIELLVVVAILGVLAAVVTLNVGKFIGKGTEEALATELHNVQTAVVAYMADSTPPGAIPADVAALITAGFILSTPTLATYAIDASTGEVTQTPN